MEKVNILNTDAIARKIKRMAYEIWEKNNEIDTLEIIGIADGGVKVAKNIIAILEKIADFKLNLTELHLDKVNPLSAPITLSQDLSLDGKHVLLIDDVANSGKTLLYALKPIMEYLPTKVQIAVLVDREHKNYPIIPDIVGHVIATTLQDTIIVNYEDLNIISAHIE